jgi:alkylmercury lyase
MAADRGDATTADGAGAYAAASRFVGDDGLFRREDGETRRVGLALYRLIAGGVPVTVTHLGDETGLDGNGVRTALDGFHASNIEYDAAGAIVGFRGLSQRPTRHVLRVDGRALYAWCAFDALFLAEVLGRPVDVASTCAATGMDIHLTVTAEGIGNADPAGAVMSFIMPEDPDYRADIRATFCRYVKFFAARSATAGWRAENPGTVVLTLDEAHALGRIRNQRAFGEALAGGG